MIYSIPNQPNHHKVASRIEDDYKNKYDIKCILSEND